MAAGRSHTFVLARQPIVDADRGFFGYELLFRSHRDSAQADFGDGTAATATIIDGLLVHGVDDITQGVDAFVNVTAAVLHNQAATLLQPPSRFVIEVTEDIEPTTEICERLADLRVNGYRVALDDVEASRRVDAFAGVIDIVKVEWPCGDDAQRAEIVRCAHTAQAVVVAEKIETAEEFRAAVGMGVEFFQGFLIARTMTLERPGMPQLSPSHYILLDALSRTTVEFEELADIVSADAGLTYTLLRYANSAYTAQRQPIESVRECLILVGQEEVRRLATLVVVRGLVGDAPAHAMVESLVRASFCESVSVHAALASQRGAVFLAGLLSRLDAILGLPRENVADGLPLNADVRDALRSRAGEIGALLQCAEAYEHGRWPEAARIAEGFGLKLAQLADHYHAAVLRAERVLSIAA
ncbi:MAG TPA: HDOD domain-containing protein [Dehalococcoidia bacterium]|nr:HDOD domain-containing protein [Dehalococcoidia bacterium]